MVLSGGSERQASWSPAPSAARGRVRDGRNVIERQAIALVRHEIAAMPASLVVQLALWPDEIASWARAEGTSESLVYNMLARRKPYVRMRGRLAERLEVPAPVLSHLIDARRPLPSSKRSPDSPPPASSADGDAAAVDWSRPPYPPLRDGTSPVEKRAVRSVELDVASMPASAVVGLALWPETLAGWSREQGLKASVVWATLAGAQSERVRGALARRLGVSLRDLDDLIAGSRAEPRRARLFADLSREDVDARPGEPEARSVVATPAAQERAGDRVETKRPPDEKTQRVVDAGQMDLGL